MRPRLKRILTCLSFAIVFPASAATAQDDAAEATEDLVEVRLIPERSAMFGGETVRVGVHFKIKPHWHVYWKSPGASGAPTEVTVTAPAGFKIGQIQWPRPNRFEGLEGITYGYEEEVVLFVPVTAPDDYNGSVPLTFDLFWLVCRQQCLMGDAKLTTELSCTTGLGAIIQVADPVLAKYGERIPSPLKDLEGAELAFDGEALHITGPAGQHDSTGFYPIYSPGVRFGEASTTVESGRFDIRIPVTLKPGNALGKPLILSGLVVLGDTPTDPSYEFTLTLGGETDDAPG